LLTGGGESVVSAAGSAGAADSRRHSALEDPHHDRPSESKLHRIAELFGSELHRAIVD
jgi:hypothetical protein